MKIFQCEMLTTNETVMRCCDGGKYPECSFCTLKLHPGEQVLRAGSKFRPPLVIIDDYTGKELLDKCLEMANDLNDTLRDLLKKERE